ncbi:hypothetical protein SGPA1_11132 [Streptomyces misionensis JCM 4497]
MVADQLSRRCLVRPDPVPLRHPADPRRPGRRHGRGRGGRQRVRLPAHPRGGRLADRGRGEDPGVGAGRVGGAGPGGGPRLAHPQGGRPRVPAAARVHPQGAAGDRHGPRRPDAVPVPVDAGARAAGGGDQGGARGERPERARGPRLRSP